MLPLSDAKSSLQFPIQTFVLMFIIVIVFLMELSRPDIEQFIETFALVPSTVDLGNLLSLGQFITAIFLHAGFLHIASNGWFLWVFGDNVEEVFRNWYIAFFIFGGIVGNIIQYIMDPNSSIPILGASGSVAAVLGAYIVFFPKNKIKTLVPIFGLVTILKIPASIMLVYWFFSQLFNGAASIIEAPNTGGVAWFAHIGGFAAGWIIAKLLQQFSDKQSSVLV